jgi:protoporphyrinogen oxidase
MGTRLPDGSSEAVIARVVVIGSGAMGLAAAYHAVKAGHEVTVLEAAPEPGGMAAHFDLAGLSTERFYHFVCKTDEPTFALMRELGIGDKMRWTATTMGLFTDGKLYPWGNPVALLTFPGISLLSRLRYGLFAFVSVRRNSWDAIEPENARSWITRWCGKEVYDKLWGPLFNLKFFEYADNISATWIWTRVRRIGRSRKSLMEEKLGYIEGGSQTLVDTLDAEIKRMGGTVLLSTPAQRVTAENGRVTGVETPQGFFPADAVICTVPTPLLGNMVPDLPADWKAKYDSIHNLGICCLVFKLKRAVTPHFWVNISEPSIEIPGIVEFSNLRPVGDDHVVYVPYYMPVTNEKFSWSDDRLLTEAFSYLKRLNPALTDDDVKAASVARLKYAQPVCEPNFYNKLPPVVTPIAGLQIADTCFYYPEDRGVSESVRFGREMAARVSAA